MRLRRTLLAPLVVLFATLALPSAASAHAYLIHTSPSASETLNKAPAQVQLTFDEAVAPRFAIISVTNAQGRQETTGSPTRLPSDPETLVVPVRTNLPVGWYLVYWRAISADGHPVQGSFTFAVGANPGTEPSFKVPSIAGSATSPDVLIARWVMFLAIMGSIGLFVFRMLIARGLPRAVDGANLRNVSRAFVGTSILGLVATAVYLDFSAAIDSLHSVFDLGTLVPLYGATASGHGYLELLICMGLFCIAGWSAIWLDDAKQPQRSVAALGSLLGALLAAAAVLQIPGSAGHAAQTSPRGVSLALDWLHLVTGSLWLGGLLALTIVWVSLSAGDRVRGLAVVTPRFSRVAFTSVLLLLATGIGATIVHMPTLDALWKTGYGVVILVKAGLLLAAAAFGAINHRRTVPRLVAAVPSSAALLRATVATEALIVTGAVFAGALLSSLAPPPPAFALQSSASSTVGPGNVAQTLQHGPYRLELSVTPNRAASPDTFTLNITKDGEPVHHATVNVTFNATTMLMPQQEYQMKETRPGVYTINAPALSMVGKWALDFTIHPRGAQRFSMLIVDNAR